MSSITTQTIESLNPSAEVSIPSLDPRMARAWVNFNGTGAVAIRDSHQVSSVTDAGTGLYNINFENAFEGEYCVVATSSNYETSTLSLSPTTSQVRTSSNTTVGDSVYVNVVVFSN